MKLLRTIGFVSILGGILVHLAVLIVVRIQAPLSRPPFLPETTVSYVGDLGADSAPAIVEQASLLDSAPLFMPTRWNPVSEMSEVAGLKEATEIFLPYAPRVSLADSKPGLPADPASTGIQEISLPDGPAFVLSRYGRARVSPPAVPAQGPAVKILPIAGDPPGPASRILPAPLAALSPPVLWSPVRFYLHLAGGIPVGLPLLAQSSGFADWDEVLQGFLGSLDFYSNLDDGYYRLTVFP